MHVHYCFTIFFTDLVTEIGTGDTADTGNDFETVVSPVSVEFGPGDEYKDVTVTIIEDDVIEGMEWFTVSLTELTVTDDGILSVPSSATVWILDQTSKVTFCLSP